jgi:ATP synthase subunit 6
MLLLATPLEQFKLLPIFSLIFGLFDFSITNVTVILVFGFSCFSFVLYSLVDQDKSFYLVPNRIQVVIETFYKVVYSLIFDNIGIAGKTLFPFLFTLFIFVLMFNVIGLVPYSFTITSHLVVTFFLALMSFVAVNIICLQTHGVLFFTLFLPGGSSVLLSLLLVPIEIVSYIFRPISLAVRLFANMMAGHTLLKVIAGFAWTMMLSGGTLSIFHLLPLAVLVALMFLELGVAMIQAYVFTILTCIYLKDSINLH